MQKPGIEDVLKTDLGAEDGEKLGKKTLELIVYHHVPYCKWKYPSFSDIPKSVEPQTDWIGSQWFILPSGNLT